MKLTANVRTAQKKNDVKRIRRAGDVPGVIYSSKKGTESICVKGEEFAAILRSVAPGQLPTTVFALDLGGKERKALIKDVQYDPTTYRPIHLDFEELLDGVMVNVKVPISCTGVVDCVGIKLGGFLRQVIREVRVQCLPKDIPTSFAVDVSSLAIHQTKRLADIQMPKGVRPLALLTEVVVVIAKR
jgi:large subunit ribosomal protein L25